MGSETHPSFINPRVDVELLACIGFSKRKNLDVKFAEGTSCNSGVTWKRTGRKSHIVQSLICTDVVATHKIIKELAARCGTD